MKKFGNSINLDRKSKVVTLTVLLALLCSYPYVFSRFFPIPDLNIIIAIELLILAMVNFQIKDKKPLPKTFKFVCAIQILFFVILGVYHLDVFYLMRFALFVVIAYYSLSVINNSVGIAQFTHINNLWITLQAIMGFVGFILIIIGVLHPILEYTSDTYSGLDLFYGITTTNSIAGIIPRIAGFFDEPGAFAQWGIYSLVLNKLLKGSKKVELLLIVGLTVTFSLAYFLQLVLYFIAFYCSNIRKIITFGVSLSIFGVIAYNNIPQDSDLYYLTLRRVETNNGSLETNRDDLAEAAKKEFVKSPVMGCGYSNIINSSKGEVFDNPYETLATSGIIGTFALYLPLLVILIKYRKNGAWQAVLILTIGYLQRPFHVQYIHYLMMYMLFCLCYYVNKTENPNRTVQLQLH